MSHEIAPYVYITQVTERLRKAQEQIKLLYAELGWSEETIRKWERGELDVERENR